MEADLCGWREAGFAVENSKLGKGDKDPGRTRGDQKVWKSGPGKGGGRKRLHPRDGGRDRTGWTPDKEKEEERLGPLAEESD